VALSALASMPGGESLCHGDFHPDNVILSAEGPVVIDWVDATVGNPLADVARTTILLEGERAAGGATSWAARTVLQLWLRAYIGRYLFLRPGGNEEYRSWQPIVAAGRMNEGIDSQQDWLRGQAEAGFGRPRE
jgi:aminoglycoside/choline kinase family phosphotransferase